LANGLFFNCHQSELRAVVKPVPSFLKLRTVDSDVAPPDVEHVAGLAELCQAFTQATGWPLEYAAEPAPPDQIEVLWSAPVEPGVGASPGHLRIELGAAGSLAQLASRVPLEAAEGLATAIARQLQQTFALRKSLWKREAELAAGVPVAARPDEPEHLALRLEAALKSGAQLLECDAAALYTLDEGTSELKLRSSWGLPFERLEQPARPLATALADLEALLGHAVALENMLTLRPWNVPEACEAAMCVPVSSPTMPLGTLWFFSQSPRPFTSEQTNLAELVAGRLAAELDRALLLHEQVQAITVQRQLDQASRMQQHSLSQPAPAIDGYEIAGWTSQAAMLGGAFHEWRMLADGRLALLVADACDGGVAGALVAAAVRATLRDCLETSDDPTQVLTHLHESLLASGAGDQWIGIALAILSPQTGDVSIVSAGRPSALWLATQGPELLLQPSLPLGLEDPTDESSADEMDTGYRVKRRRLELRDSLLLYNRGFVEAGDEQGRPLSETALAQSLIIARDRFPNELIDMLCDRQEAHALAPNQLDRAVVVIQRLP
jgi:serine phosphatase RsbU (regulator of sigma subunit)